MRSQVTGILFRQLQNQKWDLLQIYPFLPRYCFHLPSQRRGAMHCRYLSLWVCRNFVHQVNHQLQNHYRFPLQQCHQLYCIALRICLFPMYVVVQPNAMDASLTHQFPNQRVRPVNPTVSTRTKFPSQCEQLIKLFVHCMTQIGSFCKLHAVIVESQHPTLHFHRVLDQFAASTVWRYLSIWQHFSDALRDMDLHLDRLTEVELADVFVSLSLSHRSDPPTGAGSISAIKAVRWMTKVADIQCLQDIVYGSIISSYLRSKIPRERKEAVPLALYIVLQWERRILQTVPSEAHAGEQKLRPQANHSVSWDAACYQMDLMQFGQNSFHPKIYPCFRKAVSGHYGRSFVSHQRPA